MKVAKRVGLGMLLVSGCQVQSGGEQSPIFQGEGIVINDNDGEGRTISIDPSAVPQVIDCGADQVVSRTSDGGWSCIQQQAAVVNDLATTTLSCNADEIPMFDGTDWVCAGVSDPDLNSLGQATLDCTESQVPKFSSGAWTCADDDDSQLGESELLTLLTNAGYLSAINTQITDLLSQVSALEQQVIDLQYPLRFDDDFERASLGGPLVPDGVVWETDDNASTQNLMTVTNGAMRRDNGAFSRAVAEATHGLSVPTIRARLRFVVNFAQLGAISSVAISFNAFFSGSGGACPPDCDLVRIEAEGANTDFHVGSFMASQGPLSPGTDYYVELLLNGSTADVIVTVGDYGGMQVFSGSYSGVDSPGGTKMIVTINDETGFFNQVKEIRLENLPPS